MVLKNKKVDGDYGQAYLIRDSMGIRLITDHDIQMIKQYVNR